MWCNDVLTSRILVEAFSVSCYCFLPYKLTINWQLTPQVKDHHLGLHFLGLSKMFRNFPLVISRAGKGKMSIGYCNIKDKSPKLIRHR